MSYRVEISRQAEMDIRTIYAYIREHGPANPSARCARPELHSGLPAEDRLRIVLTSK
ncbi:hypothetical protein MalM14_58670 [Gimesia chilikensis]|nr:hypothetical protein MalM14_58670 [Gimesia chilikensis]